MHAKQILASAAFVAFLVPAISARAADISGSVAWSGFVATSGTVNLFGYDPNTSQQEQIVVPIALGVPGTGSYAGSVTGGLLYSVRADLVDAAGNTLGITGPIDVPVDPGANAVLDIAFPADYGFGSVSGTVSIDGQPVSGGTVALSYYFVLPNEYTALVYGSGIAAVDADGHYSAAVGAGTVNGESLQTIPGCIPQVRLIGYGVLQPGESIVVDLDGAAPPSNPPPGRLVATVGMTRVPQAAYEINGTLQPNTGRYTPDCQGGYALANIYPPVTAGTYPLLSVDGQGSDQLTPGPWLLGQALWSAAYPDLNGRADYRFAQPSVEVSSGADAHIDLRREAAFVRGHITIDSSRWAPPSSNSYYRPFVDPSATSSGGDTLGFTSLTDLRSDPHLVLSYELPVDPAQSWTMKLDGFIAFLDDSLLYMSAQPPKAGALPTLAPGQVKKIDFPTLFTFGTGSLTALLHVPISNIVTASFNMTKTVKGEGTLNLNPGTNVYQSSQNPVPVPVTLPAGSWQGTVGEYGAPGFPMAVEIATGETMVKDVGAPDVTKVLPKPGTVCKKVTVSGVVKDADGVASLKVNGKTVNVKKTGGPFSLKLEVPVGDSLITIVAKDKLGNSESRQRPVHRNSGHSNGCSD